MRLVYPNRKPYFAGLPVIAIKEYTRGSVKKRATRRQLPGVSTYGDVAFRLSKLLPDVDPDILDGWIADRYQAILDRLDWERRTAEAIILTVASYETGTVAVTEGSASVTGTDTVWTSAMTGRQFRVPGQEPVYTFTYVSATSGTLDRAYEGEDEAESAYVISQSRYALPAGAKFVDAIGAVTGRPMDRRGMADFRYYGAFYGSPNCWALAIDKSTGEIQVEFWPIPDTATGLRVQYQDEAPTWATSGATLVPWLRPSAIIAGVQADAAVHAKDWMGAERFERQHNGYMLDMIRTEANLRGPVVMQMAQRYQRPR